MLPVTSLTPRGLLLGLCLSSVAHAQLEIHEVLVDPVGPNSTNQVVELRNVSGASFTPAGWFVCVPFAYAPLPSIAIPAGGFVRVHVGRPGIDGPADFFLPPTLWMNYRDLQPADTLLLYDSSCFACDGSIRDFVSWGGGTARAQQAVNVLQWTAVGDTVPLPPNEGQTIAYRGNGDTPEAWFRDATPTLGLDNGQDQIVSLGNACPTSRGLPSLGLVRPAVDGAIDFAVTVQGGASNGLAAFVVGLSGGNSIPFVGCSIEATPDVVVPALLDSAGTGQLPLPLVAPGFSIGGASLYFQSIVIDTMASNGLYGATSGAAVILGN
jgi:hypothetical protein